MNLRDRLRGDDGPAVHRYQMREKLMSIGDDSWIENEDGDRVFKVNGKAARVRDTFILEDPDGAELAKIQERKVSVRDKMAIEFGDSTASVHKALIGMRDRYNIDVDGGPDLKAHGNFVDHEYEIEQDGDTIATISKKWFRVRDSYGIEITPGQNDALLIAITVCVDEMSQRLTAGLFRAAAVHHSCGDRSTRPRPGAGTRTGGAPEGG